MKNVMLSLHLLITFIPVCSLGLALFRLNLKTYYLQILLISFIIANVCLLLNIYEVKYLTSIIQPILFLLGYWLIFRLHFLYSFIIVIIIYSLNSFFEYILRFIIEDYMNIILSTNQYLLVIGSLLFLCNSISCYLLIKYRIGFSFIPAHSRIKPQLRGNFRKLIYVGALVFVTTSLTGISFYYTNSVTFVMHLVVLCLFGVAVRRSVLQDIGD
jgi:hypothetical protein